MTQPERVPAWVLGAWVRATLGLALSLALGAAALALAWHTLETSLTISGSFVIFFASFVALLPLSAGINGITMLIGVTNRRRVQLDRVAGVISVVTFAYLAYWLARHDVLGGLWPAVIGAAAGILFTELQRRLVLRWLEAGLLSDLRHPRAPRAPAAVLAALAVLSAVAVLIVSGTVMIVPSAGSLRLETRPTKRTILVQIDGISRDDFLLWTAMRRGANLESIAQNGATAHVAWPHHPPEVALQALGEPQLADPVREDASPTVPTPRELLANAIPIPSLLGSGAAPALPSLWALCEHVEMDALVVGWSRAALGDADRSVVLEPADFDRLGALLEGDSRALDGAENPALLRRMREMARPPHEDWRHGARLTDAEQEAASLAGALGAGADGLWRDRFLVRAFVRLLGEEAADLAMLRVSFGVELAQTAAPGVNEGPRNGRDAVIAYLDALDDELGGVRRGLRAGDALLVLVTPWDAAGREQPAPWFLFGEKAVRGGSAVDAYTVSDVNLTLLYLLGLKIPAGVSGRVAWELLTPGLRELIPALSADYTGVSVEP